MYLPFLKKRWPRIADPMNVKVIGSPSDILEEHCIGELMTAAKDKDVISFRKALEALVMNCFETGEVDALN
jgi:hypothetical protein